jgi:hypothetical protein
MSWVSHSSSRSNKIRRNNNGILFNVGFFFIGLVGFRFVSEQVRINTSYLWVNILAKFDNDQNCIQDGRLVFILSGRPSHSCELSCAWTGAYKFFISYMYRCIGWISRPSLILGKIALSGATQHIFDHFPQMVMELAPLMFWVMHHIYSGFWSWMHFASSNCEYPIYFLYFNFISENWWKSKSIWPRNDLINKR